MTVALSSFRVGVELYAPNVTLPLITYHLRESARDFCERSKILRVDLDPQDLVASTRDYTLTPPDASDIVCAIAVQAQSDDDGTLEPVDPYPEHSAYISERPWAATGTTEKYFFQRTPEIIRLTWDPETTYTGGLFVVAAVKPSVTSTVVDDLLYNHWHEGIEHGALARILAIPGQQFTNMEMATSFGVSFQDEVNKALMKAENSHTYKPTLRFSCPEYNI